MIVHLIQSPMELVKVLKMNVNSVGLDNTFQVIQAHVNLAGITPAPTQIIRTDACVTAGGTCTGATVIPSGVVITLLIKTIIDKNVPIIVQQIQIMHQISTSACVTAGGT